MIVEIEEASDIAENDKLTPDLQDITCTDSSIGETCLEI